MKQKLIGDILYVFQEEAYEINPPEGAEVIYVPEDSLTSYKTLNPSLTLNPYNYNAIHCVEQDWEQYRDRGPADHLILYWADGCDELIREEDRINSVENPSDIRLFGAQGVSFMETDMWGRVYRYDLTYDGGDAWFNNPATQEEPSDLFISTHVEDDTIQSVTISITPHNYTARHEYQDPLEDWYEDLKYVFVDNDDFTSEVVGSMYYAEEYYTETGHAMYALTIDGVDATFAAQNSTDDGVVTVRVYNPDNDETYFTQSSAEHDLANWTIQVGEGITGEFIFTQYVPQNSASFDDETNEVTVTLVNTAPFHSDALATLFTSTPNFTITRDGDEIVNPIETPNIDTQDPDNPVLLGVDYGNAYDVLFTVAYDNEAQNYMCTPEVGQQFGGVYVFTPVQL